MPMPIVFKLKPLLLSPFHKSKSSPPPLTIADVLLLQDDEEDGLLFVNGSGGSSNASKLRRIAARFFSGFNCGKLITDQVKEDDDVAPHDDVADGPDSSPEVCCLIHLIADSRTELQKMMELRAQMESVLQNVKEGLLNKDLLVSTNIQSNDGNRVEESLGFNSNLISNRVLFDQSSNCEDAPKEEDCLEGMDRLEAELEIELERLQLHLDTCMFSRNPPEETIEESTVITVSARSCSINYSEAIGTTIEVGEKDYTDAHRGVPPNALERKLHELLESRQEQQIRELEAALKRARKELSEKEKEISWWKDTAHAMLKHAEQPSILNFQYMRHHDC